MGEVIWQIPGGLAAAGEDLQAAGLRELHEETGYAPAVVTPKPCVICGVVWDNPGMGMATATSTGCARLVANGRRRTRDAGEFVTLHWVTPAWLKQAVRSGEINDRVVVAAVAYLLLEGEL